MKGFAATLILLSLVFAQDSPPSSNRVEWNASAPDALKELPDGRTQRTANAKGASVSIIADVVPARRFVDPPTEGGENITYIVVGIRNTSQQTVQIAPEVITLRAVGKKEKVYKYLPVEKVIERAWQDMDNRAGTLPAMTGSMSGYGGTGGADASMQTAAAQDAVGRGGQASAQVTGAQVVKLRDKALLPRELAPGEQVMGLVFFYPYEKKDQLELTVPVGETTFVIPFSGRKK